MNRRVVTPLQPSALGSTGANSTPPSPARSNQVAGAAIGAGQSPTRRTPLTRYKNSSDNMAAVLGSSTSSSLSTPVRPNTRGQSTPPASRFTFNTPNAMRVNGSSSSVVHMSPPSAPSAGLLSSLAQQQQQQQQASTPTVSSVNYEFKVIASSGRSSTIPLQLQVGSGCLQGFRPTMEDEHFSLIQTATVEGQPLSIIGILDGHCGRRVADLGARIVPDCIMAHPAIGQNNALALVESIVQADKNIFQQIGKTDGGSTLICAVIHGRMLFVACLGDARAVVYDGSMVTPMSEDHKPTDPREQQRIVRCGGSVQFGRVCGCLAVSRALGDYELKFTGTKFIGNKELVVSNIADVKQLNVTDATKFLVLACDGLWDVLSNEEAVYFVVDYLKKINASEIKTADGARRALDNCSTKLADYAIEKGSMDNVSVTLIFFHDVATTIAQEPPPPMSFGAPPGSANRSVRPTPVLAAYGGGGASPPWAGNSSSPVKRAPMFGRR